MEYWDKGKKKQLLIEFEQIVSTFTNCVKELRKNYGDDFDIWVYLDLSKESGVMHDTENKIVQNTTVLDNVEFKIITGP